MTPQILYDKDLNSMANRYFQGMNNSIRFQSPKPWMFDYFWIRLEY